MTNQLSKEERFLQLISCINIQNPVMDFDRYGNILYWFDRDGNWICAYNLENAWLWLSYERVWSVFEKEFNLNYDDIQAFIKTMVEQHFKMRAVTPHPTQLWLVAQVEQHFKLKDTRHIN